MESLDKTKTARSGAKRLFAPLSFCPKTEGSRPEAKDSLSPPAGGKLFWLGLSLQSNRGCRRTVEKQQQIPYIAIDFSMQICYNLFEANDSNKDGDQMANYTEAQWNAKKIEMMEKCFEGFSEMGLHGTGIRALARYCGCGTAKIYTYFEDLDDLIIQSTEYCMSKVEDDFMAKAPTDVEDLWRFIDEIPYWTAKEHGKKYRLMYQIYTHPKYREYGQKFFQGVDERYTEYAKSLEPKLGIPYEKITPLIFILIRACVHYALFEDEFYLKSQIEVLKETLELFVRKYNPKAIPKED